MTPYFKDADVGDQELRHDHLACTECEAVKSERDDFWEGWANARKEREELRKERNRLYERLRRLWVIADLEMPNHPAVDEAYVLLGELMPRVRAEPATEPKS